MKHPIKFNIKRLDPSLEEVADILCNLRYDSLSEFLGMFAENLLQDAIKDKKNGRIKLSRCLERAASSSFELQQDMQDAWEICKPYMENVKESKNK